MTPRLDAYIWWCEDEVCDCTQPVVVLRMPPTYPRLGWESIRLWEGTFQYQAEPDELLEQKAELTFAASRFHVKLDESFSGSRDPIPMATAIHYAQEAGVALR